MAELATIGRPYAEALFKSVGAADTTAVAAELDTLAAIATDPQMRQFADNPKVGAAQVFDLLSSVFGQRGQGLSAPLVNFLRALIDNGRLGVLPEIAGQFKALANLRSGVSEATIYSAFDIDPQQLPDVIAALERRFGRKLTAQVVHDPSLIGGIRVVVGDEVLDTSVKARLEQMRAALTA